MKGYANTIQDYKMKALIELAALYPHFQKYI